MNAPPKRIPCLRLGAKLPKFMGQFLSLRGEKPYSRPHPHREHTFATGVVL